MVYGLRPSLALRVDNTGQRARASCAHDCQAVARRQSQHVTVVFYLLTNAKYDS